MPSKDPEKKKAWDKARHARDKEKRTALMREYRKNNLEKERERGRKYNREHRDEIRGRGLQRKYGMTVAAFESMLAGQGFACAACGTSNWGPHGPVVDHDHGPSGKVRGILCAGCNLAIGHLRDNPAVAMGVARYLESNQGEN